MAREIVHGPVTQKVSRQSRVIRLRDEQQPANVFTDNHLITQSQNQQITKSADHQITESPNPQISTGR
jgi:hypothetical protein